MKIDICIYHSPCVDGTGSAWVVSEVSNPWPEFHGADHGSAPPDVTGKNVLIVDFSYKAQVLKEMAEKARSILIIDHHKTAREALAEHMVGAGVFTYGVKDNNWATWEKMVEAGTKVGALFDMERSGAIMVWDFFNPGKKPPYLLEIIQDRDIWLNAISNTPAVLAALNSHDYLDLKAFDAFLARTADDHALDQIIRDGEAIRRSQLREVAMAVKPDHLQTMVIGGHKVLVANVSNKAIVSDVGHYLAAEVEGNPFGVCYRDVGTCRRFSLCSMDDKEDVSAIAKMYGGGGHRNASGFEKPLGWSGDNNNG